MLNVFGLLRPDTCDSLPRSFVHLEFVCAAGKTPDSTLITDADVTVSKIVGDSSVESFTFTYTDFDSLSDSKYWSSSFIPGSGTYQLICRKNGFPELTAETTMPRVPVIRDGYILQDNNQLSFDVVQDEYAGLIEVILDGDNWQIRDRFILRKSGDTPIILDLNPECTGICVMTIYVYDLNLSEYLTANMSVKPNVYLEDFSTVNNGFGCFGSMNVLVWEVILEYIK